MSPAVAAIYAQAKQLSGAEYQQLQGMLADKAEQELDNAYLLTPAQEARLAETIRRLDAGESALLDGPTSMARARQWVADYFKNNAGPADASRSETVAGL
jgi:hypothetical protein